MTNADNKNINDIIIRLRQDAETENIRVTAHAHQEMFEDNFLFHHVIEALSDAVVLENYSEHKRGPCCLICGKASNDRYIHIVCSTAQEATIIITVYEPNLPKWKNPFKRSRHDEM